MQIPLILSGIFYGANGQYKIPYIDCLFLCVSSMCVTGLATVNLSTLTTFQQFLMYFQMIIGSMVRMLVRLDILTQSRSLYPFLWCQ
jgi:hypothetical protein